MKDYEIVVGLEVHAELNTESKIFCDCKNAFGLEVNTQVCPSRRRPARGGSSGADLSGRARYRRWRGAVRR